MKKALVFVLFASTLPAFAHGPLRGAMNDTAAIGKSFGKAGKDTGKNVYHAGRGIVRFSKWLVS